MIQLIKYEWKKAFLKKTIVILMVIFIIIDLIKIVDIYHKSLILYRQAQYGGKHTGTCIKITMEILLMTKSKVLMICTRNWEKKSLK